MSKSMSQKKSDLKAINAIVRRFFAAFISSDLANTKLSQLQKDFLRDAVIVSASPTKQTVEKLPRFLKPRQKILTDGRLRHFRERELSHVTTIVGDIAERRSKYIKKGLFNGAKYGGQGIKFFHFIKTSRGWKISALIWTDEK